MKQQTILLFYDQFAALNEEDGDIYKKLISDLIT